MAIPDVPDWVVQGGAVGFLGLAFLLIMFGGLVPGRFYKEMKQERNYWRDAALKQQGHTEALLPSAQATVGFIHGLQASLGGPPLAIGSNDEPGGEDDE